MRISTKGRFAVSAMIEVAIREKFGPVSLSDVALRQQISLSYLEQMFCKLRHHGLVASTRGPGGGYTLGRSTEAITVADIIGAVETPETQAGPHDRLASQDLVQDLWDAMNAKVFEFMQSVTLSSLVLDQIAKGVKLDSKPACTRGVFQKPEDEPIRANIPNSVFALGQMLSI